MSVDNFAIRREVLGTLRSALLAARARLAMSAGTYGIGGSLDAQGLRIERLAPTGDLGRAADTGAMEHSRWVAIAQTTLEGINEQMVILGGSAVSFSRVWSELVVASGNDLVAAAKQTADIGQTYLPYVLAVVGLVAVAMILGHGRALVGR